MLERPTTPGLWHREGKNYRVWKRDDGSFGAEHIDANGKAGEDPLTIWTNMREWVARDLGGNQVPSDNTARYFGTERFAASDYETLGDAVLADPTVLLKPRFRGAFGVEKNPE